MVRIGGENGMSKHNVSGRAGRLRWYDVKWIAVLGATLLVVGCAGPAGSQPAGRSGVSIGVVEPQRVLSETDAGKKAMESLTSFTKSRQGLVESEVKDLRRMEEDLMKQSSVLSANARKEREEQLRRRMMEYQQKAGQMEREVQEKQRETMEGFRAKIERVVTRVAQQMGLAMVVEKGKGSPTVYHEASLDITAKVIEEFNKGGQ
jgi:outer membrane protein